MLCSIITCCVKIFCSGARCQHSVEACWEGKASPATHPFLFILLLGRSAAQVAETPVGLELSCDS